jgi:hypothetical protein
MKSYIIGESIQTMEYIPTIKCMLVEAIFNFDFIKERVEKVFSSSIDFRTIAISGSLKNSRKECLKMR